MQNPLDPSSIKNIFWDVDGVLADLNHAYYHFLTGHPNYRDQFKGLKWEQLPEVLPILPEYGALELKTHPELGTEMDRDFCADQAFFKDRPLYPKVIEVLKELNQLGYRQFTMSATFDVEAKTTYLRDILSSVLISSPLNVCSMVSSCTILPKLTDSGTVIKNTISTPRRPF